MIKIQNNFWKIYLFAAPCRHGREAALPTMKGRFAKITSIFKSFTQIRGGGSVNTKNQDKAIRKQNISRHLILHFPLQTFISVWVWQSLKWRTWRGFEWSGGDDQGGGGGGAEWAHRERGIGWWTPWQWSLQVLNKAWLAGCLAGILSDINDF